MRGLVLMDLDDTLISRRSALAGWIADFCTARQLSAEAEQMMADALRDRSTPEVFAGLRERLGLTEPARDLWTSYVSGMAARVSCPPGMLDRLDLLRAAGWSVGILTNGTADIQRAKILASGVADRVDAVWISEELGVRKPNPAAFRGAVDRCGHGVPGDVWMVGNSAATDIAGAAAAGLRSVWVSAGAEWVDPYLTPDHIAETAVEAADFLLALPAGPR